MTITTRGHTGRQATLTTDGFGALVLTDDTNHIWADIAYTSSSWSDYSNAGYIALSDSSGTPWYYWTDEFGTFMLSSTAPSDYALTTEDTGTSGSIIYFTIEKDSTTWYAYPDGFGSLTVTETEP